MISLSYNIPTPNRGKSLRMHHTQQRVKTTHTKVDVYIYVIYDSTYAAAGMCTKK